LDELRRRGGTRILCRVKGSNCFTQANAARIRALLSELRVAERDRQKRIRDEIRHIGFYISDWERDATGFTVADFDDLVSRGLIRICPS
jgi:hypothetical protein